MMNEVRNEMDHLQSDGDAVQVWCHICGGHSTAKQNGLNEYECIICQEAFVEEINQGVEEFLETFEGTSAISANNSATSEYDRDSVPSDNNNHSTVISNVVERVLGLSFPHPAAVTSSMRGEPRPIGIVVSRQTMIGRTHVNTLETNAGIFNLLSSLTEIRQSSPAFDTSNVLSNGQFEQFLHHVLMNETSHAGAPPATDEMISGLHRKVVESSSDAKALGDCSISQESFEVDDVVLELPCGHRYKEEPILHWLKMHRTCPVCRIDISSLTIEGES